MARSEKPIEEQPDETESPEVVAHSSEEGDETPWCGVFQTSGP
jgi:hypothetical protein